MNKRSDGRAVRVREGKVGGLLSLCRFALACWAAGFR